MKGSHRKGIIINHDAYPIVIDIQKVVVIRSTKNPALFYNEFHKDFLPLSMADWFRQKRANELMKTLKYCEKVCEQKLYGWFRFPNTCVGAK